MHSILGRLIQLSENHIQNIKNEFWHKWINKITCQMSDKEPFPREVDMPVRLWNQAGHIWIEMLSPDYIFKVLYLAQTKENS